MLYVISEYHKDKRWSGDIYLVFVDRVYFLEVWPFFYSVWHIKRETRTDKLIYVTNKWNEDRCDKQVKWRSMWTEKCDFFFGIVKCRQLPARVVIQSVLLLAVDRQNPYTYGRLTADELGRSWEKMENDKPGY